jgi:hypothetical protein
VVGESSVSKEAPVFGEYESKVLRTLPGSNSVRTTVPQVIANLLEAAPDTTLIWSFDKATGSATVRLKREASGKKSSKRS